MCQAPGRRIGKQSHSELRTRSLNIELIMAIMVHCPLAHEDEDWDAGGGRRNLRLSAAADATGKKESVGRGCLLRLSAGGGRRNLGLRLQLPTAQTMEDMYNILGRTTRRILYGPGVVKSKVAICIRVCVCARQDLLSPIAPQGVALDARRCVRR